MTTTNNTFNPNTADLLTINRKLKALASQKTHAKQKGDSKKYAAVSQQYSDIAAIKSKRFPTKRSHSYANYTDDEIAQLDLYTSIKAVKSLQSLICLYPHRTSELAPIRDKFISHRDQLKAEAQLQQLQAQLNK